MISIHTAADKDIFNRALREISDSLTRQAAEKDLQKEILEKVKDTVGIEPKMTRRVAKLFYDQNKDEKEAENDEVFTLYETVVNGSEDE